MKLTAIITDKTADIAGFEPASGTFDVDSPIVDDISSDDVKGAIVAELALPWPVKVQIFHSNGHAIVGETPSVGNFIVTRK